MSRELIKSGCLLKDQQQLGEEIGYSKVHESGSSHKIENNLLFHIGGILRITDVKTENGVIQEIRSFYK